ncbi:MAG: glycosyl transferase [Acidobacteria bacterium]|nr:MAG: glycosyl transferase [Acidobacteriota bacterium]
MTAIIDRPANVPSPVRGARNQNRTTGDSQSGAGNLVEIVVPVYNEEAVLESSIRRLVGYLNEHFPFDWAVMIADNASADETWQIAQRLATEIPGVDALRLEEKGRGRALRTAWRSSGADVVAYMDVDLSTDLNALLPLVAPLLSGHSDVAIGSRLSNGAHVVRGPKRELISRSYNFLLRRIAGAHFHDAQCGFKALRRDAALALLDNVENENWFFDTELLLLAEQNGMRIHEVPVDWIDDPDSRVKVIATALEDLRGIWRVKRRAWRGELEVDWEDGVTIRSLPAAQRLLSFAIVGTLSTLLYLAGFALLRAHLSAMAANAICLVATTVLNTSINRRFTFGITGSRHVLRHHVQAGIALGAAIALTSAALAAFGWIAPEAGRLQELVVVVAANAAATVLRYILLNGWIFREASK